MPAARRPGCSSAQGANAKTDAPRSGTKDCTSTVCALPSKSKTRAAVSSLAPLTELTAARVFDFDGNAHTVEVQSFVPDLGASVLAFAPWALLQPGRLAAGIELDVTVGYGAAAVDVPEPLRQAIRLLVGHWYENRGLAALGTVTVP